MTKLKGYRMIQSDIPYKAYLRYREDYKRRNGSTKNARNAWLNGGWKRFAPELTKYKNTWMKLQNFRMKYGSPITSVK